MKKNYKPIFKGALVKVTPHVFNQDMYPHDLAITGTLRKIHYDVIRANRKELIPQTRVLGRLCLN